MNRNLTTRGFTLIEMMVVVAIIGLLATLAGKHVIESYLRGEVRIAEAKCKEYHDACFLYRVHKDPWGNDYRMEWDGEELRIRCCGPDREEGTGDDICYEAEE